MIKTVTAWCLRCCVLFAALPFLLFSFGQIRVGKLPSVISWSLATASVGSVVFALRVAFPWPARADSPEINSSACWAIALNFGLVCLFVPWFAISAARFGFSEDETQGLLVLAGGAALMLAAVVWIHGPGVVRAWRG